MKGTPDTWFSSLSETDRTSFTRVTALFDAKYAPAPISLWRRTSEFWFRDQKPQESVEEYYADMSRRANEVGASADMTRYALMKGLRPELRTYVLQQNPTTTTAFLDAAKIAKGTVVETGPSVNAQILEAINCLENKASIDAVDDSRRVTFSRPVATSAPRSPVLTPARQDSRSPRDIQGRLQNRNHPTGGGYFARRPTGPTPPSSPPSFRQQTPIRALFYDQAGQATTGRINPCGASATAFMTNNCLARRRNCRSCGQLGHFAVCCCFGQRRRD